MRRLLSIFFLLCIINQLNAQNAWRLLDNIDWLTYPAAHPINENEPKGAYIIANQHNADWNISNSGTIIEMDDSTYVWTIGFRSESALTMSVMLENVALHPNEQIAIYSPSSEEEQIFTIFNQSRKGIIQSMPIKGDSIIVEYQGVRENKARISITAINCGFISLDEMKKINPQNFNKVGKIGDSNECEVDASCSELDVSNVSQSVCRLFFNGSSFGTGTLINNTARDGKPYIITSAHVIPAAGLKTAVARFDYEMPACEGFATVYDATYISDSLVFFDETRDIALILLNDKILDKDRPYYSGWDLSPDPQGPFYTIHHPMGDVKKISSGTEITEDTYSCGTTNTGKQFDKDNHWKIIKWDKYGSTESGSSGGGLWTSENLFIGGLSGGYATCSKPQKDYFWRLNNNWHKTDTFRLDKYLDPINSRITKLNGEWFVSEKYEQVFGIEPNDVLLSEKVEDGTGYIAGHNKISTTQIAQQFGTENKVTKLVGVYLTPYYVTSSHGHYFSFSIYNEKNNQPNEELYRSEIIKNSTMKMNRIFYQELPESLRIDGKFYVVVNLEYGEVATDTLSFYYSFTGEETNGALFKINGTWQDYGTFTKSGKKCNLFFGYLGYSQDTITITSQEIDELILSHQKNNLVIQGNELGEIEMYDIKGVKIYKADAKGIGHYKINMSTWPSGIYLITIYEKSKKHKYKILNKR